MFSSGVVYDYCWCTIVGVLRVPSCPRDIRRNYKYMYWSCAHRSSPEYNSTGVAHCFKLHNYGHKFIEGTMDKLDYF